jgi:hypothetical protein
MRLVLFCALIVSGLFLQRTDVLTKGPSTSSQHEGQGVQRGPDPCRPGGPARVPAEVVEVVKTGPHGAAVVETAYGNKLEAIAAIANVGDKVDCECKDGRVVCEKR